ncbi:MAG: GTPase ObgE [Acidobacteriota bacterium]|nr:GTPase ObgE [Acidobacteriota bacterium]
MFIDEAKVRVKAGDGGNGCMAFRREKFVPRGGPSGGDGGHGGDVLMSCSLSHNTLVHFRFNPEHKSQRGGHGLGSNCSGHAGEHTVLKVPVGTLLYDDDTGELIHDFAHPNQEIVIAKGGRGGRGNQHFATSTHQAPREHELGRAGEARNYRLELRLLADAGLVGFPNVGKSTLISVLSAAKPRIANYAFTTLEPNLGVVQVGDFPYERSFTVADMPGLIEGAHLGAGLGVQFLKHIERTSVLVHLVDVSDTAIVPDPPPAPASRSKSSTGDAPPRRSGKAAGLPATDATPDAATPDPVDNYNIITAELKSFDPALAAKPTLLVAAKADIANPAKLKKLTAFARRKKLPLYLISAVTGEGVDKLKFAIAEAVQRHRGVSLDPPAPQPAAGKPPRRKPKYPPPAPNARGSRTR